MSQVSFSTQNLCGFKDFTVKTGVILLVTLIALTSIGVGVYGLKFPLSYVGLGLTTLGSLGFFSGGIFLFVATVVATLCCFEITSYSAIEEKEEKAPLKEKPRARPPVLKETPPTPRNFKRGDVILPLREEREAKEEARKSKLSSEEKPLPSKPPEEKKGSISNSALFKAFENSNLGFTDLQERLANNEGGSIRIRNSVNPLTSSREFKIEEKKTNRLSLLSDDEIGLAEKVKVQNHLEMNCFPDFIKHILQISGEEKKEKAKEVDLSLTEEEKTLLSGEIKRVFATNLRDSWPIERFESGEHCVFTIRGIDGKIFKIHRKKPQDEDYAKEYVKLRKEARVGHPATLYVPACRYEIFEGKCVIIEEFIEDIWHESMDFQRGLFRWGVYHEKKEIQSYFKKVLLDLAIFICKTKFGDCKLNNTLMNEKGVVILPDIDKLSAVVGLTASYIVKKNQGLFYYLKSEWMGEFLKAIEPHLSKEEYDQVVEKSKEIYTRLEKREKRREAHLKFLENKNILSPVAPVRLNRNLSFSRARKKVHGYVHLILNWVNSGLSFNPDVATGRKLTIPLKNEVLKHFQTIEGKRVFFAGIGEEGERMFQKSTLGESLDFLKKNQVIFDYKFKPPLLCRDEQTYLHMKEETCPYLILYY